ncbi:MAG: RNA methyltransferase [Calothrix sp. SM1_5_4]|nr:RNA methyltransferase [Calothrix sp. SM1_5_4]
MSNRALRDDEFLIEEGDRPEKSVARVPLKLIVENLRSAFNVGALFRTSECLGVSEILLCGYTPGPDDEKTARTAMGTSAMVPWRRVDRAGQACEELRREGYKVVALETAATAISCTSSSSTPPRWPSFWVTSASASKATRFKTPTRSAAFPCAGSRTR